jgi:hypothetical protein
LPLVQVIFSSCPTVPLKPSGFPLSRIGLNLRGLQCILKGLQMRHPVHRHPRERGGSGSPRKTWISPFAGMTVRALIQPPFWTRSKSPAVGFALLHYLFSGRGSRGFPARPPYPVQSNEKNCGYPA